MSSLRKSAFGGGPSISTTTADSIDEHSAEAVAGFQRHFSRMEHQVRDFALKQEANMKALQSQIGELNRAMSNLGHMLNAGQADQTSEAIEADTPVMMDTDLERTPSQGCLKSTSSTAGAKKKQVVVTDSRDSVWSSASAANFRRIEHHRQGLSSQSQLSGLGDDDLGIRSQSSVWSERAKHIRMRYSQMEEKKYKEVVSKRIHSGHEDLETMHAVSTQSGPTKADRILEFLHSSNFDHICAVLLTSNAVFIGIQVEYKAREVTNEMTWPYITVDTFYNIWFVVELIARCYASGLVHFFLDPEERNWNMFDCFVVFMGVVEMFLDIFASGAKSGILSNLSAMRTIRVARIVRVARVIRLLRFFRSLRMLLAAIFSTLKSCVWTAMLLCTILYMFGITFTQGVVEYKLGLEDDAVVTEELQYYFGSLPRSIFTLYKAILGGIDWEVASQALSDVHWFYVVLFIMMVTFVYLAVMNVVSGLFLQSALDHAAADKEDIIQMQIKESQAHTERFLSLFSELDVDGDGTLNLQEMEAVMGEDRMKGFLQSLDISFFDAWTLFKLLDADAGGTVSANEFVDGCMRIRGNAKSVHMAQMLYENKWLMDAVWELAQFVEEAFKNLPDQLSQAGVLDKRTHSSGVGGTPSMASAVRAAQGIQRLKTSRPPEGGFAKARTFIGANSNGSDGKPKVMTATSSTNSKSNAMASQQSMPIAVSDSMPTNDTCMQGEKLEAEASMGEWPSLPQAIPETGDLTVLSVTTDSKNEP